MHARATRARVGAGPGADHRPDPRTKRAEYLDENVGALDCDLTAEDLARIDRVQGPKPSPARATPAGEDVTVKGCSN